MQFLGKYFAKFLQGICKLLQVFLRCCKIIERHLQVFCKINAKGFGICGHDFQRKSYICPRRGTSVFNILLTLHGNALSWEVLPVLSFCDL